MKTKIDLKFEEDVYKKYYPLVYTTCKRFLVEKAFLADAAQSVFLLYIKKEDSISANLSSWFYWASVNICKVVNKDSKKHLEKSTPLDENAEISEENKSQEEFFLDLGGILEKLPTKKRDMLLMRYYENKTYREIGAYFKCKEDSVRMMIDRTLLYLKNEVKRKEVMSGTVFAQFFGLESTSTLIPTTNHFILQNSLLQQSFIKGVQTMYLISKLKIATVCVCLMIPLVIPLSTYIFAENDNLIAKKTNDEKSQDLAISEVDVISGRALKFLVEKQSLDGSWSDVKYESNSGVTALCCMALMSEGSRPRVGKYGKNLEKGFDFLLSNVQNNGVIAVAGNHPIGAMYEHVYSSMALLLAYQDLTWHPELKEVIENSIKIISKSSKDDGGWRYDFSREGYSDMSVSSNVLWFLKASKKAGFVVSDELINNGENYIVTCGSPEGQFRYRSFALHATPNMVGLGLIALNKDGNVDNSHLGATRDRLEFDYNKSTIEELKKRRYQLYGCFYASVGMYYFGDKYWDPWFLKATQVIKSMQKSSGEFQDELGNNMYTTALAAIILQAPKGKLPIYERGVFSDTKGPAVIIKSVEEK